MSRKIPRLILGIGIPVTLFAVGFGPFLTYRSQLPGRVATNYDLTGTPDNSMTQEQLLLVTSTMIVIGVIPCIAISLTRKKLHLALALAVSICGAIFGACGAAVLVTTTINQRGLKHWQDATLSSSMTIYMISIVIIAGILAAFASYLIYAPTRNQNLTSGGEAVGSAGG